MRIVIQEHAAPRRRLRAPRGGLSLRRRLAGALTGLVVLPLLTLALVQLRGVLDLSSRMLLYLIAGRYMGAERAEEYGRRNAMPGELLVRITPNHVVAQADIAD